jgi:hypothetical protein
MKSLTLLTLLTIFVYSGISHAQQCSPGCQAKVDALQNQVIALQAAISRAPFLQKFVLTPARQGTSQAASAELELPNYLNALLVHVTVDHNLVAVLLPAATPRAKSGAPTPNQTVFPLNCHEAGNATTRGGASVSVVLGLLRQEPGKDIYGIKVVVDGCTSGASQIPVEIAVLSKP